MDQIKARKRDRQGRRVGNGEGMEVVVWTESNCTYSSKYTSPSSVQLKAND